jgi:hypoxanthine phosphoribosyltransferase
MTDPPVPCEIITWGEVERLARKLALAVRASGFVPDLLVAIGRGGYPAARLLSDYLGIPDLTEVKVEHYQGTQKAAEARVCYPLRAPVTDRQILLIDDVTDTGDSFRVAVAHLRSLGTPRAIRTAALHHKTVSPFVPDYFGRKLVKWRWIIYPWAQIEDLSALIRALVDRPATPEAIAGRLAADHGIRIAPTKIREVMALASW